MQLLDVNGEPTAYLHIHLAIFLKLDAKSLKSARQVSRDWNKFITTQIWMNKKMRKRLKQKLDKQWRRNLPVRRELVLGDEGMVDILMMCCNETHLAVFLDDPQVILGVDNMGLRLYHLHDLTLFEKTETHFSPYSCAMGKSVIAASGGRSQRGGVAVWSGDEEREGLVELYWHQINGGGEIWVAAEGDFIVVVNDVEPVTVTVLQAVNNVVRVVRRMTIQGRRVQSFSVDYPRMLLLVGWPPSQYFMLNLESGGLIMQRQVDTMQEHIYLEDDFWTFTTRETVLAFPLVLTTDDRTGDVTVYNLVTNEVVTRSRLAGQIWSLATNGKVVIVRGSETCYTLLGLSDENGEEVMWRREIVTAGNMECVINKTCALTGSDNVVTVDNYWLIDDECTEEEEVLDYFYNIAWLYESDGDQNGYDIEEGDGKVTDDTGEREDGVDDEEEDEDEDEAVAVKMLREVGLSGRRKEEGRAEDKDDETHGAGTHGKLLTEEEEGDI